MKKYLLFILFYFYSFSTFCQTNRSYELLRKGIESNEPEKIDKAISQGVTLNSGLLEAIKQDNLDFVKYFVEKGADPTYGIYSVVKQNNTILAKYLLEKGVRFNNVEIENISGQVYLINSELKDTIPVVIENGAIVQTINTNKELETFINTAGRLNLLMYKTKTYSVGNPLLIYAINRKSIEMINLLIANGFNVIDSCLVRELKGLTLHSSAYDFLSTGSKYCRIENGWVITDLGMSPAVVMKPIEYAMSINAEKSIFDALLKHDSIPDYKFEIQKVSFVFDSPKISDVVINSFDYGFNLTCRIKNEDVFGLKLAYKEKNGDFKEFLEIIFPIDSEENKAHFTQNITQYYHNILSKNNYPNELIIKIELKEYGRFTDERDGQQYKTVKIGNQIMLAENFRFNTPDECWVLKNDESNLKKYGYLYTWKGAENIAPKGWHLPSIAEWDELYKYLGGKIDEVNQALNPGGKSGFNQAYSGVHSVIGFTMEDKMAMYWSSTRYWYFKCNFYYSFDYKYYDDRSFDKAGLSVRLFKDK